MKCRSCEREKSIAASGLCSACYSRLRRRGTLERKNQVNHGRQCSEADCVDRAFAKGLCTAHYYQADHPMKGMWKVLRHQNPGAYPATWDDFEVFVREVGDKPSSKHQLRRLDASMPYCAENVAWKGPVRDGMADNWSVENRPAYAREWLLRKKYGLSADAYQALLEGQGNLCASCREKEVFVNKKTGRLQELGVDHDHQTGEVRGLLCVGCNRGIGYFCDSPEKLRAAADYLERHQSPRFVPGMTLVATLPEELGAVTGLRIEGGAVVASSKAGIDFVIAANKLDPSPGRW